MNVSKNFETSKQITSFLKNKNLRPVGVAPTDIPTLGTGSILLYNQESANIYTNPMLKINQNNISTSGDIVPTSSNIYSLGLTGSRWREVYIGPGSLNISGPAGFTGSATIGSNLSGIAYSQFGFATPFINVGPSIDEFTPLGTVGGWNISGTGPTGGFFTDLTAQLIGASGLTGPLYSLLGVTGSTGPTGPPLGYTGPTGSQGIQGSIGPTGSQGIQGSIGPTGSQGIQGSTGPIGSQGIQGSIGPTGSQGVQGSVGPTGQNQPIGNTLRVDSIYGNDLIASSTPYSYPFLTISAALSQASSGQIVIVNAGIYNESLTIPDNVSLQGSGAQAVVIQKLNVTSDTTLITAGLNCRIENFTANLSSSGAYNLIGIDFPSGSSISTKLRNSIWTISSSSVAAVTVIGVRSNGVSSTNYTPVNAIQRSTINVISSSTGITRGMLVGGPNRIAVRDIVIYARGTGPNIIGLETTNASAYAEIKTSTVGGVLYDINRTLGTILIGFTDLLNNKANGNSFSVVTESSSIIFGVVGNPSANRTYYLVPGTLEISQLPSSAFQIPITQNTILFSGVVRFTGTIPVGGSLSLHIHKNGNVSPSYIITLNAGENTKVEQNKSVDFSSSDYYHAELVTVGNPGTGTFTSSISFY
jgi:hypothetical protein